MKKKTDNILSYHAIFQPAKEGGYTVSFPDFSGCVTFGNTFETAKEKAREVLELWLEELAENGETITAYHMHPIIDEVSAKPPSSAKISYAGSER